MRAFKSKYMRILLVLLLMLSFSLNSASAITSYSVPFAEPAVTDSQGYLILWMKTSSTSSSVFPRIFTWQAIPDGATSEMYNAPEYMNGSKMYVQRDGSKFTFDIRSIYYTGESSSYYITGAFNVIYDSGIVDNRTFLSVSNYTTTHSSSYEVVGYCFGGPVVFSGFDDIPYIAAEFTSYTESNILSTLKTNLVSILSYLSNIDGDTDYLKKIYELMLENSETVGEESTDSLPSQGIDDYISESDRLEDNADVSADLSVKGEDISAGNGYFGNAFGVVWNLTEQVLGTHAALFTALYFVLGLGLISLVFARR